MHQCVRRHRLVSQRANRANTESPCEKQKDMKPPCIWFKSTYLSWLRNAPSTAPNTCWKPQRIYWDVSNRDRYLQTQCLTWFIIRLYRVTRMFFGKQKQQPHFWDYWTNSFHLFRVKATQEFLSCNFFTQIFEEHTLMSKGDRPTKKNKTRTAYSSEFSSERRSRVPVFPFLPFSDTVTWKPTTGQKGYCWCISWPTHPDCFLLLVLLRCKWHVTLYWLEVDNRTMWYVDIARWSPQWVQWTPITDILGADDMVVFRRESPPSKTHIWKYLQVGWYDARCLSNLEWRDQENTSVMSW